MGITADVSGLCNDLSYAALPSQVTDRVKYLILDYLGVAIRGTMSDSSQPVYRYLNAVHAQPSGIQVPATSLILDPPAAALALGVAAHSLELDDVVNEASLHPAVSVISAALASGFLSQSNGKQIIEAITAGYELMVKLGIALNPAEHYKRGFHPTATCGTFGAAIAAAKLMGLSRDQITHALGIAGSQAAGSMEFLTDGAYTKRFHGGWSAHSGLIAAALAGEGFTGPQSIIEGKFGFLHSYSLSASPQRVLHQWGEPYEVMKTSIKPHACCRYKQGSIDCIIKIMAENELSASDIAAISISILEAGYALVAEPADKKRNPASIVDAQFSMPFGAAIAVLYGNAFLDHYSLETISLPSVKMMMDKVCCQKDSSIEGDFPRKWPARVTITTVDNRRITEELEYPKGDPENPLSWEELINKFRNLVSPLISEVKQDEIISCVQTLEDLTDCSALMRLLSMATEK